ncbi:FkbM family methyltransferase [Thalassoporum mexicanum]|uniref:FkbM family methyltransferase n=1 Tax=Thalassoporum mexicanum TaxID=3457544 RepID=UPI0012E9B958|nr:FkbM family methyltransferase [Pseudanabaena sp. PCC 7367]
MSDLNKIFAAVESIDFLDIGCSGSLDDKWAELLPLLAYTGFDPNAEECDRLSGLPHKYKAVQYLPYAIAGEAGTQTMYKTESIFCYSLLQPNSDWLNRFSFADLFSDRGQAAVTCTTLDLLATEQGLRADIMKIDSQGLELPILEAGNKVLSEAFCVETETGFLENYHQETTYAQIDQFMRSQGFLMFDLQPRYMSRKNHLAGQGAHQPLWCEVVWLFDFVGQHGQKRQPSLVQALKALLICKALKYFDYGFELATYFKDTGVIDQATFTALEDPQFWQSRMGYAKRKKPQTKAGKLLNLLPESINKRLLFGLKEVLD